MAKRPLLILPTPERITPPKGRFGQEKLRRPTKRRQVSAFGPIFGRLRAMLGSERGRIELRDDPSSLAPDRVIVFEIAGSAGDFYKAISRIQGFEFVAEYETEFENDEHFAIVDARKGKEGLDRTDKPISGRFYLAMPDTTALTQLLSLWERWSRNEALDHGLAPFEYVFANLHDLRPWGPRDRIPDETIRYWQEKAERSPDQPIRTEVELWFHRQDGKRRDASRALAAIVNAAQGGRVVHEAVIPEIAYHGALIDIPAVDVQALIERRSVSLALADDVMFIRPQSQLTGPIDIEVIEGEARGEKRPHPPESVPIAALLDGFPLQNHSLLANRIRTYDPDGMENVAIVSRRVHGTAMASLIIHGDMNSDEGPIGRPLYVRPIMYAPDGAREQTDGDHLLIDTIHRAILEIKGAGGHAPTAPAVFLANLSIGDELRPFAGVVSPLARLLDYLAQTYGLLFLVSAGNVSSALRIPDYQNWTEFEQATLADRQRAVLVALNAAKHERTILSPAEAMNVISVGAQHHDNVVGRPVNSLSIDPFADTALPNVSSGLGLGYRRSVKPEIYLPGGREHLRLLGSGEILEAVAGSPQRLFGLRAAAPDATGRGRVDYMALSDGTSSATALATRAAHRIFEAITDRQGGSPLVGMDPQFYAVVVKSLLIHTARWSESAELLRDVCGPSDGHRSVERTENISRFLGFGIPNVEAATQCASNRATLVGFGELIPNNAHKYRVPLPACLESVTDSRSLSITVAWFSPIKVGHQSYRCVRLEAEAFSPGQTLGVGRMQRQPADAVAKRGTIFHEHYHGSAAVPFIDDGHLSLRVWCKEDAGVFELEPVRYGIAVTIESESLVPIYDEIEQRLRVAPKPKR